ncbi:hypothetical protein BN1263400041 [Stenotrophomonas indicatrix]|nr:hypothetical protein BN1263400041 [Stenotrophomonas indicatrix]
MRLAAAARPHALQRNQGAVGRSEDGAAAGAVQAPGRVAGRTCSGGSVDHRNVGRNLSGQQGNVLHTAHFALAVRRRIPVAIHRIAGAHRGTRLQVGQGERGSAVTAVHGSQQRKQRLVLRDGKQLSVAKGESPGREREPREHYLPEEDFGHTFSPERLVARTSCPLPALLSLTLRSPYKRNFCANATLILHEYIGTSFYTLNPA